MASYTLTLTPQQDALLSWIVAQYNKEHDTALSNLDYVNLRLPQLLAPYAANFTKEQRDSVAAAFSVADVVTQAQIKALLRL